jgi:hypothetical protein
MTETRGLQLRTDPEVVAGTTFTIVGSNKPCCWCGGDRRDKNHPVVVYTGIRFTSCQVPTHVPADRYIDRQFGKSVGAA